jgi:hypothetical protein
MRLSAGRFKDRGVEGNDKGIVVYQQFDFSQESP